MNRVRTLMLGLATATALAVPLGVQASASAATGGGAQSGADQALTATAASGRAAAIRCLLRVHNPHYSHHSHAQNKHRVNVTADVKCDHRVAHLRIKVRLYKEGRPYKTSGWRSNSGKASISQNAARRCVKKQHYQGEAWATVVFPPGYHPPTLSGHVKSQVVYISKCKRS